MTDCARPYRRIHSRIVLIITGSWVLVSATSPPSPCNSPPRSRRFRRVRRRKPRFRLSRACAFAPVPRSPVKAARDTSYNHFHTHVGPNCVASTPREVQRRGTVPPTSLRRAMAPWALSAPADLSAAAGNSSVFVFSDRRIQAAGLRIFQATAPADPYQRVERGQFLDAGSPGTWTANPFLPRTTLLDIRSSDSKQKYDHPILVQGIPIATVPPRRITLLSIGSPSSSIYSARPAQ